MEKILTPEEKKYLKKVSNYLQSLGMKDGTIEIEVEDSGFFEWSEVNYENITHFDNNYTAEIPSGLIQIIKKVFDYCEDRNLYYNPKQENINYQRIVFDIDAKKEQISVSNEYSYYGRGDNNSIFWDGEEGKEIFEEWESDGVFDDLEIPDKGVLTIKYNGSGDSGYIENSFDENGDSEPAPMEDWCYQQLENNFGGWEINEGSDGEFAFNFHHTRIELSHTYNTEENSYDTLFEESFA